MPYIFVIAIIIGIFYYGAEAIKDQRERDRSLQRAYDIYIQYPHILRKRLNDLYLEVNENSDSAEEIRVKIANNKAVRYFLKELDNVQSKHQYNSIWKEITNYQFLYWVGGFIFSRHIELSSLENDLKYDNQVQEETRIIETQEKIKLKEENGEWF